MRIENQSTFNALLITLDRSTSQRYATVIIKSTYDLDAHGQLLHSHAQQPILTSGLATDYGLFHGEKFPHKVGVDVCVLGTVRREQAVDRATVRLRVGERSWEIAVIGDRIWEDGPDDTLRPSVPAKWTEMTLSYAHAYGGNEVLNETEAVLWGANPLGRGHYLTREQARGRKLANLEDPNSPVETWTPEGKVVGWAPYPSFWSLRSLAEVIVDDKTGAIREVRPGLFNHAHPEMVLDHLDYGTLIQLEGLGVNDLDFVVPPPPASVKVVLGTKETRVEAPVDGIFIWADERKLVITQRGRFTYRYEPYEERKAVVYVNEEPGGSA